MWRRGGSSRSLARKADDGLMAGKPKRYEALLTQGVEQDLESIHDYIAEFDCVANANYVLDQLMKAVEALVKYPE